MKDILTILAEKNFDVSPEDKKIYAEYTKHYSDARCFPNHVVLIANISFLFSSHVLVDHLLATLEADVKELWEQENKTRTSPMTLHTPANYVSYFGLTWPYPTNELISNKTHHLLSRVLLKKEQAHGFNQAQHNDYSPVPTFVGLIDKPEATKIMNTNHQLWNEDPRVAPLFYHGKMTHRIQIYLLIEAVRQGILPIDNLTIIKLIEILTTTKNVDDFSAFALLLDTFPVAMNVPHLLEGASHVPPAPLTKRGLRATIGKDGKYTDRYLFGMDPYFLHSYLMTAAREKCPHLSTCVTQIFCKSAFDLLAIEKRIGYQVKLDRPWPPLTKPKVCAIPAEELTIGHTLLRQSKSFLTAGTHVVTPRQVVDEQHIIGKSSSMLKGDKPLKNKETKMESRDGEYTFYFFSGVVQYRQMQVNNQPIDKDKLSPTI